MATMQHDPGLPFKPPPVVAQPDYRAEAMRNAVAARASRMQSRRRWRNLGLAAGAVLIFLIVGYLFWSK